MQYVKESEDQTANSQNKSNLKARSRLKGGPEGFVIAEVLPRRILFSCWEEDVRKTSLTYWWSI